MYYVSFGGFKGSSVPRFNKKILGRVKGRWEWRGIVDFGT